MAIPTVQLAPPVQSSRFDDAFATGIRLLALGMAGFLILSGCSKLSEEQKTQGPIIDYPLARYDDSTVLTMHEGSRLSWVMRTLKLVKHNRSDRIEAKPVDLRVYDSNKVEVVHVTSDSGTVDEAVTFLAAIGHVHGRSHKGLDIVADSLRWNKAENRVSTESRVRVISEEGDTLRGRGFVSDANLDNWQILSDVQGVFQNVEERVEAAENDTLPEAGLDTAADIPDTLAIVELGEAVDTVAKAASRAPIPAVTGRKNTAVTPADTAAPKNP